MSRDISMYNKYTIALYAAVISSISLHLYSLLVLNN